MLYLELLSHNLKKTIVIIEISTFKFVKMQNFMLKWKQGNPLALRSLCS